MPERRRELIDDPATAPEAIRATLRDQRMINHWLGGGAAVWQHSLPYLRACRSSPLRVLELACGGADISRRLVEDARRRHVDIAVTVIDRNPAVIAWACEANRHVSEMSFLCADALDPPVPDHAFDLVILASFLHHLSPAQAVIALQRSLRCTRGMLLVSDVVRTGLAEVGIRVLAHLANFHPVSRHDGPLSIHQAYTPRELAAFAETAQLPAWHIYRHPFSRMTMLCRA